MDEKLYETSRNIPLKEVLPEPIELADPPQDPYNSKKFLGLPIYSISSRSVIIGLRTVQKYSVLPVVAYFPLHAVNTLIIPSLSPSSAPDDVLMMVRELLPSFTTKLLVSSSLIHVGSGLILRLWQLWSSSALSLSKRSHHSRHKGEEHIRLKDASERNSQRVIGLIGGLSGYFVGFNKNFRVSPQVISGYIMLPFLAYHLGIMKFIPDSSNMFIDIDFNFIKWLLSNEDWKIRWLGGILPLSLLIWSGTYHIFAGMCQYLRIKDILKRRKWSNFITILVGSGLWGIYRLSKWPNIISGSDQYDKIFKTFYLK